MTADEFKLIAAEAGPLDDAITGIAQVADERWVIGFEDAEVELELADEGGKLVVTAAIAVPPPERLGAIAEALLAYSMLWRDTGGVRAALPARSEPAVLIVDLPTQGLTPKFLAAAAHDMAAKASAWRTFFADAGNGDNPSDAALGAGTMIRV